MSTSRINSVQKKVEIGAKTPYNDAQGYATSSCSPSMANAEINILEAEKLHCPIILVVRMIPAIPCKENITAKLEGRITGRRQYPRTLVTQPNETAVILIKFHKTFLDVQLHWSHRPSQTGFCQPLTIWLQRQGEKPWLLPNQAHSWRCCLLLLMDVTLLVFFAR